MKDPATSTGDTAGANVPDAARSVPGCDGLPDDDRLLFVPDDDGVAVLPDDDGVPGSDGVLFVPDDDGVAVLPDDDGVAVLPDDGGVPGSDGVLFVPDDDAGVPVAGGSGAAAVPVSGRDDPVPTPGEGSVPDGTEGASGGPSGPSGRGTGGAGRRTVDYAVDEWRGIVMVTGTGTEVGKTVVTAAISAAASAAGLRVAVVKPGQTGVGDGMPSDVDTVVRLAGPATARILSAYPDPLAPLVAARVRGLAPLELYAVVDAVRAEAESHDLVLVEGAGGLLVPMGLRPSGQAWTLADLAVSLGAPAVVVAAAGLGTLNHTALTLEALDRRGVTAGVVLGAWPVDPGLVHWANFTDLVPHLMGAVPEGAGRMDPGVFRRSAPGWLTPRLYGVLDDWRAWADES